ncbi:tetratricopeptide repeat protein [Roseibium sp. HPY-6]|uniref:tetratricopeptide repeat protein n=1 Tax=Roseibium sp. HPY-6 TaxID=3229852 RepID=UPI00338DE68D
MKLVWCLFFSIFLFTTHSNAAGKSGESGGGHSWRLEREGQGLSAYQGTGSDHFGGMPDAQELEQLLAREAAEDPEDLFRLGLAYENSELWEPDYKRAFSYFQRSEALGFPWAKSQVGYYYETGLAGPQDYEKAVRFYQEGADFGDSWSGLRLGYLYLEGEGIRQHDGQAFFWIQWASRGGVAEATSALGWLHENGRGTAKDLTEAARLYRRAGEAGNLNAWVNLGLMHETGVLGTPDYELATELYRKASDAGFSRGKHNLGTMYYWGQGVAQDQKRAVSLFRSAVDLGYSYAHVSLGLAYEQGGGVEKDYARAADEYQKAIDAEGSARAKAYLGWLYQEGLGVGQDLEKSRALYEDAVAEGQPFALTELGFSLVYGSEGRTPNVYRGRRLLEKAAADEYLAALLVLADMYDNGTGVARDSNEAFHLYQRAADLGDPDALASIGDYYMDGDQVDRDFAKARELYSRSLDAGNKEALLDLGYLYTETDWEEHDFKIAMEYFRKADEAGVENAATFLGIAHFHGEWAQENDRLARGYFERAAENGFYLAAKYLGYMEEEGLGGAKEKNEAVRHYELAAEGDELFAAQRLVTAFSDDGWMTPNRQNALRWRIRAGELGDPDAAYDAAEVLYNDPSQKDLEHAAALYRVAANDGNLDASVKWARLQILGEVEGADYFAAIKELKSVADAAPLSAIGPFSHLIRDSGDNPVTPKGKAERELFLGIAYANGIIFPQDAEKAAAHLQRSADLSSNAIPSVHVLLADLLLRTESDDPEINEEIMRHLRFAANRGEALAQLALGEAFATGRLQNQAITKTNYKKSLMWLRLAAASLEDARYLLASSLLHGLDPDIDRSAGIEKLQDLAVTGNADAALELGFHFSNEVNGDDFAPETALIWFKKAARFGNTDALNSIGLLHQNKMIEGHSMEQAYDYLLQAAKAGHSDAAGSVGWHLKNGLGVERDIFAAEDWFLRSLEGGSRWSSLNLAMLYVEEESFGKEKTAEAIPVLLEYADRGDAYAAMTLGRAYVFGTGITADPKRGETYYRQALQDLPKPAHTALGNFYFLGQGGEVNYEKAFEHYSKAADLGSGISLNNLGWMFENGLYVGQDYAQAASLYRASINAGDTGALVALGLLYRNGTGVIQDFQEANRLFQEAIGRGSSGGKANAAWMLLNGLGVEPNRSEGMALLEESVSQNDHDGTYYMALLLEEGKFVDTDMETAKKYYEIAADQGNFLAEAALERLQETEKTAIR